MKANQPIGIFDSGVGGLTVANAIRTHLPNENIIYFGDTAHLPYGDKSAESIKFYSRHIAEFLLKHDCKILLIACNTASAYAFGEVRTQVGDRAKVFNVIDPVIRYIEQSANMNKIGIIGTKGTINSNTYRDKINAIKPDAEIESMATPLLAPMIEEGFIFDDISNAIIRAYLSQFQLKEMDALVLACTHYPLIKNQIRKYYNFNVQILDAGNALAAEVKNYLANNHLLNEQSEAKHRFFVSDYTNMFEKIGEMFFENTIQLETKDIWKTIS